MRMVSAPRAKDRLTGMGGVGLSSLEPSSDAASVRAIELVITPDDGVPCSTPLDANAKGIRLPEADFPDLDRVGVVRVFGASRITSSLVIGAYLCGWTRQIGSPGLPSGAEPPGWEGELRDGAGKLLGASSTRFESGSSKLIARSWRFVREGKVDRQSIDEGGAFVHHESVRVFHGGASAVSHLGAEVMLHAPDGDFAVQATSDLTDGKVPVFVSPRDSFSFAAVRQSAPTP